MFELTKNINVNDLVATYQQALADLEAGQALIGKAHADIRRLHGRDSTYGDTSKPIALQIRSSFWLYLVEHTGADTVLTAKRLKELHDQIYRNLEELPPITLDNALAFLTDTRENLPARLVEYAEQTFDFLRPRQVNHKTNIKTLEGLPNKVILEWMFEPAYCSLPPTLYYNMKSYLHGMDNVFHLLDGKGIAKYPGNLVTAIEQARIDRVTEAETEYFRCKWFKVGTMHTWFKRPDLVTRLNQICGAASLPPAKDFKGEASSAYDLALKRVSPGGDLNWFPTPGEVVAMVQDRANIEPGMRVLEPSIGLGAMVRSLPLSVDIVGVEVDPTRAAECIGLSNLQILNTDFLELNPDALGQFDRIIMNPPFRGQRDIIHFLHAWEFLRPGGRIVAVMSASVKYRENELGRDFRSRVCSYDGEIIDLPAKSFASSGTNVDAVLVVVDKR